MSLTYCDVAGVLSLTYATYLASFAMRVRCLQLFCLIFFMIRMHLMSSTFLACINAFNISRVEFDAVCRGLNVPACSAC